MLIKRRCAFVPDVDFKNYNNIEYQNSFLFNITFKLCFLFNFYLKNKDEIVGDNFLEILEYIKTKPFCVKTWIISYDRDGIKQSIDLTKNNKETVEVKFIFRNILKDISENKKKFEKLFPEVDKDPLKELIEEDTIHWHLYKEILYIMRQEKETTSLLNKPGKTKNSEINSNKKALSNNQNERKLNKSLTPEDQQREKIVDKNEGNLIREKNQSIGENLKRNEIIISKENESGIKKELNAKIKIRGKIMNKPRIWNQLKITNWNEFCKYTIQNIRDYMLEYNEKFEGFEKYLDNIKISHFINDEKELDPEKIGYAKICQEIIRNIEEKIWDNESTIIEINNVKFEKPQTWREYEIRNYDKFEEMIKCAMMRQFERKGKLDDRITELVQSSSFKEIIKQEEELDFHSKQHSEMLKKRMLEILTLY